MLCWERTGHSENLRVEEVMILKWLLRILGGRLGLGEADTEPDAGLSKYMNGGKFLDQLKCVL